jgi:hypothetical protein
MKDTKVIGDQYLNQDFQKGFIINLENKSKAEASLRFNIYESAFELMFHEDANSIKKLNKTPDVAYVLNAEKFVLLDEHLLDPEMPLNSPGYVVELFNIGSGASLYKKYILEIEFKRRAWQPHSFINDKALFYIKIGDEYHAVGHGKRKVAGLFENHQEKMITYINDKGFNFKGNDKKIEKELVQVVRYYNTL